MALFDAIVVGAKDSLKNKQQKGGDDMEKPIQIAIILNKMDCGGIENIVSNYCVHMDASKIHFDFYYTARSNVPQRMMLEEAGIGLYEIPPCHHLIGYGKTLFHAFQKQRYDIVHVHLTTLSVFALMVAFLAKVPVRICHAHTTANWSETLRTLCKYALRPWNKVFATHYFACSEHTARWMYGNCSMDQGQTVVISNVIDTSHYAFDSNARSDIRAQQGIPPQAFVIGHVGRFETQKNHAFLMDTFEKLYHKRSDAWLFLVGDGSLEQGIRQMAIQKKIDDRIVFFGSCKDASQLYSAMDVFCLPSLYEGMPLVALEAIVNGLPLIHSDQVVLEPKRMNNVQSLPLDIDHWVELLENQRIRSHPIQGNFEAIDIHQAAKKLEERYASYVDFARNERQST